MQSQVVKVERIHQSTGEVLGGFYNEQEPQKRSVGMANESSSQDSESIRQLVEIVQHLNSFFTKSWIQTLPAGTVPSEGSAKNERDRSKVVGCCHHTWQ